MMSDNDRDIFHKMVERLNDELEGLPIDIGYWKKEYPQIPLEKRKDFWWKMILRFEYSEQGEFRAESITRFAKYIVKELKSKEVISQVILTFIQERLLNKMLLDEDVSIFLAEKIEEFSNNPLS